MAEGDTLDAVNAEVCYHVILDLQKKRRVIGALYHQAHSERQRYREDRELRAFYDSMARKYEAVETEIPEEWRQE